MYIPTNLDKEELVYSYDINSLFLSVNDRIFYTYW